MEGLQNLPTNLTEESTKIDAWFDRVVASLQVDREALQSNTMRDKQMESLYMAFINDDMVEVYKQHREKSKKFFIIKILDEYLASLGTGKLPLRLAFSFEDSQILCWAEIDDDDEEMEGRLFDAKLDINHKYEKYGFHLSNMVLEKCENQPVPPHYRELKIN